MFQGFHECACTEGRERTCALPEKRRGDRAERRQRFKDRWLSQVLNASGQVKTYTFDRDEQVPAHLEPAGPQGSLF